MVCRFFVFWYVRIPCWDESQLNPYVGGADTVGDEYSTHDMCSPGVSLDRFGYLLSVLGFDALPRHPEAGTSRD